MRRSIWLLAAGLATSVVPAHAQSGRGWQDLNPEEQQRAWKNYQHYKRMPDRQRERLGQRFETFQALPPSERDRLRKNYQDLRRLDEGERREFGENYRRWKSGD